MLIKTAKTANATCRAALFARVALQRSWEMGNHPLGKHGESKLHSAEDRPPQCEQSRPLGQPEAEMHQELLLTNKVVLT